MTANGYYARMVYPVRVSNFVTPVGFLAIHYDKEGADMLRKSPNVLERDKSVFLQASRRIQTLFNIQYSRLLDAEK